MSYYSNYIAKTIFPIILSSYTLLEQIQPLITENSIGFHSVKLDDQGID